MAPVISLSPSFKTPATRLCSITSRPPLNHSSTGMPQISRKSSKIRCLFSDNRKRKQEQARMALESALGGKKSEFEKWDKEIKKKEELGGGGDGGGGGWFGWGRWFGGSGDDHFWQEAQQTSLAILGIVFMILILAKGDVMLAIVFNPLLFALRGIRSGFTFGTSQILKIVSPSLLAKLESNPKEIVYARESAKERVVRKWGSD